MPQLKTLNCKKCTATYVPETKRQSKEQLCNICIELKESEEEE